MFNIRANRLFLSLLIACSAFLLLSFTPSYGQEQIEKLVILGGGPAGLSAAIYAGQANLNPLVIEETGGSQRSYRMENYPGFPEGISYLDLLERIHQQAEKFGARFQLGPVVDVDLTHRPFRLTLSDGRNLYAKAVIIALGTSKRWLGLPSEEALKGKGVSGRASEDGPHFEGKNVVVIGGGDHALGEALILANYAANVTIIDQAVKFYASPRLQEKILANPKIHVIRESAVDDILDVKQDKVTGVLIRNLQTQQTRIYPSEGVFVAIGSQPNTALFKGQLDMTPSGLLKLKDCGTETRIPGVFAAGDLTESSYRKAITAVCTGVMSALDAARYLSATESANH